MGGIPEDGGEMCYIGEINTGVPPGLGGGYLRFGAVGGGCINPWIRVRNRIIMKSAIKLKINKKRKF